MSCHIQVCHFVYVLWMYCMSLDVLCVEFDCRQDPDIGDGPAPHISVQSSVPLGVLTATNGSVRLKINITSHHMTCVRRCHVTHA